MKKFFKRLEMRHKLKEQLYQLREYRKELHENRIWMMGSLRVMDLDDFRNKDAELYNRLIQVNKDIAYIERKLSTSSKEADKDVDR